MAHRKHIKKRELKLRDQLINAMQNAIQEVRRWPQKEVQIFHHNDSDGLSSGAILTRTFERAGFEVRRFCLEKPYPALLKKVYDQEGKLIVLADFAGRIAPLLSDLNRGRNLTLILDHHVAAASTDSRVHNLDPDLYGLKGDRDIAGATTCYLFAHTWDPENKDLAVIAAIGAVGDEFFVDGCLVSENRAVALEAVKQGRMEIRSQAVGERYYLNTAGGPVPCDEFGAYLDTLGAAGFYRNGPDMGVKVCLEWKCPESDQMLDELRAIQTKAFEDEKTRIQSGALKKTEHIQWFHVENRF
jgi:single-stranded-DNA-specific exonuclease